TPQQRSLERRSISAAIIIYQPLRRSFDIGEDDEVLLNPVFECVGRSFDALYAMSSSMHEQ
ncbi:hypothetical protein, partial [Raoultibacter massiliensis]